MPAVKKKYIRNLSTGYFRIGNLVFKPHGKYGDTILATKEILSNEKILDFIERGKLEIVEEKPNYPPREDKSVSVVNLVKTKDRNIILSKCMGIRDNGKQCQTQVTYIGDEKPPLCKDHKGQIDKIEFNPKSGEWEYKWQ